MSVKKNPLFSLFELNEFKEEKYNLKPLSEEARQNIANEFFKSFAKNKNEDGVKKTVENYLHKEDKILSVLRKRESKKQQNGEEAFFKKAIRWKTLHDNAEKDRSALAVYLFNVFTKTVRKLITDSIIDNDGKMKFEPSKQLIQLLGDNELSQYILNMKLHPYSKIIECCCKERDSAYSGLYFSADADHEILKHPGEFSVLEMTPRRTGSVLYLKTVPDSVRHVNDFAVLCTRAVMLNTLQASTNEVLNGGLEDFVKGCLQSFYGLDLSKEIKIQTGDTIAESICQKFQLSYAVSSNSREKNVFSTQIMPYNFEFALQVLKIIPVKVKAYLDNRSYKSGYAYKVTSSDQCLSEQLYILLRQMYLDEEDRKYDRKTSSSYAKSYETKKNIPQKIIKAMEESRFNRYFGYVEFDEDSDVQKIMELEEEWEAINKQILHQPKKELVSLRFRKLGNHAAAGLYYPAVQCICVDVRYPSSFIHEYFHMLDYTYGKLSSTYEFSKIYDVYAKKLTSLVENTSIKLTGKYDLNYYLTRTEVFARCAEMYLTRCLGIDNSLCRPDASTGFAYPDDPELKMCIKKYFDMFMQKYCAKEEKNNEKQ